MNSDGYGLIHLAIDNHDIESVRLLVEKGSSIETRIGEIISKKNAYKTGFTPLMYAIDRGAIEIAQYFISKNAELNVKSHKGFSAISLASFKCYPELVKMLKDNGADIEIKSESGLTPIFYTIQGRGCLSAFIYLKDNGANLKWKNKKDQNYLEYAKKSNIKMFKELNFMFNL